MKRSRGKWVLPALIGFWIIAIATIATMTVVLKLGGPEALKVDGAETPEE